MPIRYMGYDIHPADDEDKARGFNWRVDTSQIGAMQSPTPPLFAQLPAAKAYIRETLCDERNVEDFGSALS